MEQRWVLLKLFGHLTGFLGEDYFVRSFIRVYVNMYVHLLPACSVIFQSMGHEGLIHIIMQSNITPQTLFSHMTLTLINLIDTAYINRIGNYDLHFKSRLYMSNS